MPQLQIIDTFVEYPPFWEQVQHQSVAEQIEAWSAQYMSQWPELLQKQIDCYVEDGEDWRLIAQEHVFPFLPKRLPAMRTAHDNLLSICPDFYGRGQQILGFDSDLVYVIYVGIGCGAGWVTTYEGKPAILFGLENIAEEGWQEQEALSGLVAHELGHHAHFSWRQQAGQANEDGPWWQLYSEGFAQWCEHLIQGRASWHMQTALEEQWLTWCQVNRGWLSAEFLRRVDKGEDLRPFFGSWYDLQGYKQTGYFLGHELIKTMRQEASLREIALLNDVGGYLRPLLIRMAE